MKYKLDKSSHSVYALQYHLVQCVKYRKRVLIDESLIQLLKDKIHEISDTFQVDILNIECDKDHFHMLFKAKPILDIPKYLQVIDILPLCIP